MLIKQNSSKQNVKVIRLFIIGLISNLKEHPSLLYYIYVVDWDDFVKYPNLDIKEAIDHKDSTPTYKIKKSL